MSCLQKRKRQDLILYSWTSLLTSEWFLLHLLEYLVLHEMAKFDTSLCNHKYRKEWLQCLSKFKISLEPQLPTKECIISWVTLKKFHVVTLILDFYYNYVEEISDDVMLRFTQCNSNLKELTILGEHISGYVGEHCFEYVARYCQKLEKVHIESESPLEFNLDFGIKCHQLTHLTLEYWHENEDYSDIEVLQLIENNKNLVYFSYTFRFPNTCIISGNVLSKLGQNCPMLHTFIGCSDFNSDIYDENENEMFAKVNPEQLEIFTKGCSHLKHLHLGHLTSSLSAKLFYCLGSYNPLLESLQVFNYEKDVTVIKAQSMECLSMGCPLLTSITFSYFNFPTKGLLSLVTNCTGILKIKLCTCLLSKEGFIALGQLYQMESLTLYQMTNMSDNDTFNMVQNYKQLKHVEIKSCNELTDTSLFSIASSCSHLETISFDMFTKIGLMELFNKCLKLIDTVGEGFYNDCGQFFNALKQRKLLLQQQQQQK